MKPNFFIFILIFSIPFSMLTSCNKSGSSKLPEKETLKNAEHETLPDSIVELSEEQVKSASITYGSIEEKPLGSIIRASGVVSVPPSSIASVCPPWGGIVRNIEMLPGAAVRKGQVLATIENQEFIDLQQNFLEVASKLEFAEAEYSRHKQLHSDDVYSTQNLQQVTSDYHTLKTQFNALGQKLRLIGIEPGHLTDDNISRSIQLLAPIGGFIRGINASNGRYVAPSDILFEIVNNDRMYLELTLFEKEMNKIVKGQAVDFFLNNESETHHAVVNQVTQAVSADKSFRIYAEVKLPCRNILPGMYVSANIESTGTRVMAVPTESVIRFNDKDYIFTKFMEKQEGGKTVTLFRMVEVLKGMNSGNFTGVTLPKNFDLASKIVVKGAFQLMAAKKNAGEMSC
jgi:membrane fusion protein, heavy metal efflux system